MFQPTMISPVRPVREQVISRNEESGGIPPLDIPRYLSRTELAKINFMHDNASDAEKPEILVKAASMLSIAALVTEHRMDAVQVEIIVPMILAKPEAHPSHAFDGNTIDHVRDYLQFAYKFVRTEIFVASMEKYQAFHKLYVPVEKLDYFPLEELIKHIQNPEQEVTTEEADFAFQRDQMMSFAVMYAMSTHQVYETVPLPEFRPMMLPMSYQLWKQKILNPGKKLETSEDVVDVAGVGKVLKLGLKNQVLSM
jgi:hypothetical protein